MRSSTVQMIEITRGNSVVQPQPTLLNLSVDEELRTGIKNIQTNYGGTTQIMPVSAMSIDRVAAIFTELCDIEKNEELRESEAEMLVIEKYKLLLMKSIQTYIEQFQFNKKVEEKKQVVASRWYRLRLIGYALLTACGMVMDGIGSFIGGQELLALTGLANPVVLGLGILFTVINCALFYSFEAGMLKNALGINNMDKTSEALLKAHADQINSVKAINQIFFDINSASLMAKRMDATSFQSVKGIIKKYNEEIVAKKTKLKYKENPALKFISGCVTFLGGLMVTGGGYFMATSLLSIVAASLLGTPVGWTIIGIAIVSSLAFYASMRAMGMFGMMNPILIKFKQIEATLKRFPVKEQQDFYNAHLTQNKLRHISEHKKTLDITTVFIPPKTALNESVTITPIKPTV